jgi:hypothetical protein
VGVKVNLPPGCSGFNCADGTKYSGRPGGTVEVADRHAKAINKGAYGQQDFIAATGATSFGTKKGRWCQTCNRLWNAWNHTCSKCGNATVLEGQEEES